LQLGPRSIAQLLVGKARAACGVEHEEETVDVFAEIGGVLLDLGYLLGEMLEWPHWAALLVGTKGGARPYGLRVPERREISVHALRCFAADVRNDLRFSRPIGFIEWTVHAGSGFSLSRQ